MKIPMALMINIQLWALQAMAEVERQAVDFLKKNKDKIIGADKRVIAHDLVMARYKQLTASVPYLNSTDIDDKLVSAEIYKAIDYVWSMAGNIINNLGKEAIDANVNDDTLPKGGLQ